MSLHNPLRTFMIRWTLLLTRGKPRFVHVYTSNKVENCKLILLGRKRKRERKKERERGGEMGLQRSWGNSWREDNNSQDKYIRGACMFNDKKVKTYAIQHEDAGRTRQILTEARSAEVRVQPGSGPNTNAGLLFPHVLSPLTFSICDPLPW